MQYIGLEASMILPLLFVLQIPAADRPIRIWMDAAGSVSRGRGVRLYVQAQAAGNLLVLHSRTDGRIEVLFPARPTDDPHLTAGTWEVRGKGEGPIWTVSEPDGTGMILAALSPDPIWFDEFSRDAMWSPDALQPSWNGADAAGGMQDIVQRMLGDGGFTYDVLTYTVAPQAIAQTPLPAPQASDDTFPTIDYPHTDVALDTCGVSSPVQCQLLNEPLFLGREFRHRRFAGSPQAQSLPTPANPQGVALMIQPIRSAPSSAPVSPRRRLIPEAGLRSRAPESVPAPTAVPLASRPVTGREPGRLAGGTPAARSALVLRYVRAPATARPADVPVATLAAASAAAPRSAPAPAMGATTVAAAMPMRAGGVMLMSRALPSGGATAASGARSAPATGAAPRTSGALAAPRTGGTTGGWMAVPMRPRR